jgi:predicted dienelactone hydrolase
MQRRQFCLGLAAAAFPLKRASAAGEVRVIDQVWTDSARNREVPVRLRVPVNPAGAPVILFSHGLGGSTSGGARWGEAWAAHGYIVLHMQHHGSDELLWKDRGALAGFNNLRRAMNFENGLLRAQDVTFILDQIGRRKLAGDPAWAAADTARVGMSGHSFGARTTVTVTSNLADRRIRAAIALSPNGESSELLNRERFGRIAIPFLSLTGTEDRMALMGDNDPENRKLPFQYMPAPDKYLLVLKGADHMVFNGEPEGRKWNDANREIHAPLIERTTLAFWDAYLRDDAAARGALTGGAIESAVGANGEWRVK